MLCAVRCVLCAMFLCIVQCTICCAVCSVFLCCIVIPVPVVVSDLPAPVGHEAREEELLHVGVYDGIPGNVHAYHFNAYTQIHTNAWHTHMHKSGAHNV